MIAALFPFFFGGDGSAPIPHGLQLVQDSCLETGVVAEDLPLLKSGLRFIKTPTVSGSSTPAQIAGLQLGDTLVVQNPFGSGGTWSVNYDASLLRFVGPGTLQNPAAIGWTFTVIGIGAATLIVTRTGGLPLSFTLAIASDGTLVSQVQTAREAVGTLRFTHELLEAA